MEDPSDTTNEKSPLKYLQDVKKIKQCNPDEKEDVTTILRR